MNILIVKLSSLGDVIHTMPAVQDIRRALPGARIDWVVERGFAPLVRRCAGIGRVIEIDQRRWRASPFSAATRDARRLFREALRSQPYDAVIDLQGLTKSALVSRAALLAPGGKRYAMANRTDGASYEWPTRWVADVALRVTPHIHAMRRSRVVCAEALGYALDESRTDYGLGSPAEAAARSAGHGVIAFLHGTSRDDKLWPEANWIALGRRLVAQGWGIALPSADAREQARGERIAAGIRQGLAPADPVTLWERQSLDALVDRLRETSGAIGVDSGLSHLAVALDLPHVQLYNFDTAWRTGPLGAPWQTSMYAHPAPGLEAVWQAWLGVLAAAQARVGAPVAAVQTANVGLRLPEAPMLLRLYSAALTLAQPLLRARLARRARAEPGYLQAVHERFGRYSQPAGDGGYVWVHAVSLGETRAAAILIERLREQLPGMRLLLTHGTATGRAEGAKLLREGDAQAWQPWDTRAAVDRFLSHFRPRIGILMETEVWPVLAERCRARGMPLVLANARLSAKSLASAERLGWLARPAYRALAAVWAQTEDDAARLRQLGANVQGVFGNLKFDATPDADKLAQGRAWRAATGRPVVMFASSREGEEALLLQALASAGSPSPSSGAEAVAHAREVQWLIVPRHPQRFDEVARLVEGAGFTVSRRSAWQSAPRPAQVWLGDSLGEMALYYGLADVALLGGSFLPLGGQNLIEAAACGCPVVMGPSTFNFAEAAQLSSEAGAALAVNDMAQALDAAVLLVRDAERAGGMRAAALRFSQAHQGAARKVAQAVEALLGG